MASGSEQHAGGTKKPGGRSKITNAFKRGFKTIMKSRDFKRPRRGSSTREEAAPF